MSRHAPPIPLILGGLHPAGWNVLHAGFRWLRPHGALCQAGEMLAFCNLALQPAGAIEAENPFGAERELQLALVSPVEGRLSHALDSSRGGFSDLFPFAVWAEGYVVGQLEPTDADPTRPPALPRTILFAGRRTIDAASVLGQCFGGWHERSRAWSGDGERFGNVLGYGICEQLGVIKGEQLRFLEFLAAAAGPAHVAYIPDDVLMPTASLLLAQLQRTAAEREAPVRDLLTTLGPAFAASTGPAEQALEDWSMIGFALRAALACPLLEPTPVLTRSGVQYPALDAVILSLNCEQRPYLIRHKRLGYELPIHNYRIHRAGPLLKSWLVKEFIKHPRSCDDVRRDYQQLISLIRETTGAHVIVLNSVTTPLHDEVIGYAPFDLPLGNHSPSARVRELNLMLYDLARDIDFSIVDVDALAGEFGVYAHIPDGTHQSGPLQAAIRAQIVVVLRRRGVPGFSSPGSESATKPLQPKSV